MDARVAAFQNQNAPGIVPFPGGPRAGHGDIVELFRGLVAPIGTKKLARSLCTALAI